MNSAADDPQKPLLLSPDLSADADADKLELAGILSQMDSAYDALGELELRAEDILQKLDGFLRDNGFDGAMDELDEMEDVYTPPTAPAGGAGKPSSAAADGDLAMANADDRAAVGPNKDSVPLPAKGGDIKQ
ncbi:hypothetical protein HDU82_006994 [Entophlyctis luteolus]|nr:hypothetical protein HDU82_006994 [Entophlyctis luteolus]KAJ3381476.1 hypothetical protein HDU84_005048 [Entophlyctis sp. JEL0112]